MLQDHGDIWKFFYPQYTIDAKDTALLHIAGLVKPDVQGERLFGYAWPKRWTDVIPILQKMYPEHKFPGEFCLLESWIEWLRMLILILPDPPENEGADLANITARPRAEEVLKWFGESGFTPMEYGLKVLCDAIRDEVGFVSHLHS